MEREQGDRAVLDSGTRIRALRADYAEAEVGGIASEMAYFPDLSPYEYSRGGTGLINIGWLCRSEPFPKGTVEPRILAKIGELCGSPSHRTRGYHPCPWCETFVKEAYLGDGQPRPLGDAEIHISAGGIHRIYGAPTLIYHYILRHQYLPPLEFLDAVERLVEYS